MTKWGVFSLSQFPDQSRRVECFDDDLRFFELAEELGYDKAWIAEHLFSTYGVVTSTQVYAAAIAQRTQAMRHRHGGRGDPVQSSAAHGVGLRADRRALARPPRLRRRPRLPAARVHRPRRADGQEPRDVQRGPRHRAQGLDAGEDHATRASSGPSPSRSRCCPSRCRSRIRRSTRPPSRPRASTRPRALGFNLQFASPFTYRTYREAWMDELEKHCKRYEAHVRGAGPRSEEGRAHDPAAVLRARGQASAPRRSTRRTSSGSTTRSPRTSSPAPTQGGVVKGYELTMSEGKRTREMGYLELRQAASVRRRDRR